MKDRIRQLMESMHMNQQTFANHVQLSTATLSSILLGRTKPTLNTVEAIQKHCPTVNLGWLINGQGEMYVTPDINLGTDEDTAVNTLDGMQPDLFSSTEAQQQPGVDQHGSIPMTPDRNYPSGSAAGQRSTSAKDSAVTMHFGRTGSATNQQRGSRQQISNIGFDAKNIDKYTRHITEIRVYYDDQTWETFVPKK